MSLSYLQRRRVRHQRWTYLLDDADCTAWIARGRIGRRRRFRIPTSVILEGKEYKITSIEIGAFKNSHTLHHLIIPDSISYIDRDCFKFLPNLKTVYIGKDVEELTDEHFCGCHKLQHIYISRLNKFLCDYDMRNIKPSPEL